MQLENLTPALLADQIKENVISYLKTTFNIKNEGFADELEKHLRSNQGIFKGPYIDIKLPFRSSNDSVDNILDLKLKIKPFEHQLLAFKRLSSKNHLPENTLVATGTGSGKTESFLFPILDHCARANKKGQLGIKAIILYPMNALAFDQSRRIAELVFGHPELKDVTAGIFVGEDTSSGKKRISTKVMTSPDRIIDDHGSLLKNPPDILLTNYKMLDLLLMKPKYKDLWDGEPEIKFLVLDEMHTYDGAQGADVAFLIRRLKAKLAINNGDLCCVGTSATLLSGIEGRGILTRFAGRLFGEEFKEDGIISESRLTIEEVFGKIKASNGNIPKDSDSLDFLKDDSLESYIQRIKKHWFNIVTDDSIELGGLVLSHKLTRLIFEGLTSDNGKTVPKTEADVLTFLEKSGFNLSQRQLHSYLSLIAHSQKNIDVGGRFEKVALFQVRVQLWLREIRRALSSLNYEKPEFKWFDRQAEENNLKILPPVFCEECGEVGYLTAIDKHHDFQWDVLKLYERYAEANDKVRYLFPWREIEKGQLEFENDISRERAHICSSCGYYEYEPVGGQQHQNCPSCNSEWFDFRVWSCLSQEKNRDKRQCPSCDSTNSLRLLASRTTTLSSIVNSQIFLSKLNPRYSKKLLAFADTVQDASHRAGYYNARTFRFNFRTAVQGYLMKNNHEPAILDMVKPFYDYYVKKEGEERTLAILCPSDLSSSQMYEDYFDKKDKSILELLKKRIAWEFYLEFSLKSQVGRTLEKTLSSAAFVDYKDKYKNFENLYESLSNELEFVRQTPEATFNHFIFGLIERALLRGSVGFDFLNDFRRKESAWELDKKKLPWISRMPKGRLDGSEVGSLPKFISFSSTSKIFDFAGAPEKGQNWYSYWFKKHFGASGARFNKEDLNSFYKNIFQELEKIDLFNSVSQGNGFKNFGLNPELIRITTSVVSLGCPECAHRIVVPVHQETDYVGMGCIITNCKGHYKANGVIQKNFYQAIYESGDIERIFAHEHTGLLDRGIREELEIEFKEKDLTKRRADAINLLSCTPTLEMGIDVGDLSATVVGALPPTAANYQQQVGRAGRKSGSALVVAVAQSRPRDLLYFEYPEELIAGHIEPPGCFVDAPDLLKRQLFAYLFDQSYNEIAKGFENFKLQHLLEEVQQGTAIGVLTNIKTLLSLSGPHLISQFRMRFSAKEISEETWTEILKEFSSNKDGQIPFIERLKEVLNGFLRHKNELDHASSELRTKMQPFESLEMNGQSVPDSQKEEIKDLRREKAAIEAQKELLGTRDSFFEFLTRYGFLPNYAFQEDTVELIGLILDEDKDARGRFTIKHKETFDRPAKLALRELAPLNTFYGGGYKLQIDQIEIGGKVKPLIEEWKICSCCGFLARQSSDGFEARSCPHCGDGQWGDISSRTRMLKFQKAIATESLFSSQVGDDAEDRQRKFYKVRPFFDVPKSVIRSAWASSDEKFVFGVEFISRMTMREINFGSDTKIQTDKHEILGEDLPKGFKICHSCGRVGQIQADGVEKIKHQSNCPQAKRSTNPSDRLLVSTDQPVMLYRELQSEAIRLLLPVSEFEAEVRVASIKAAIMLGFIKKFGGRPIHLEIAQQIAITTGTEKMARRYLVIFDSVPGGTGFLKELWNKESFYELVQLSLEAMETCSCNSSPDLDGCPRCVFAGAGQYELHNISRVEAVRYLKMILEHKSKLVEMKNGLDEVDIDSFLDSDFEYRFLSVIKRLKEQEIIRKLDRFKIQVDSLELPKQENGPIVLKLQNQETKKVFSYKMTSQKVLNDGSLKTIADFYFEPLDNENAKNIALYLDGFKYHAGPKSGDRITADFEKRQALIDGDGVSPHIVWTLTWKDLEAFEKEPKDHIAKYLFDLKVPSDHFVSQNPVIQFFKLLTGERIETEWFLKTFMASSALRKQTEDFKQSYNKIKKDLKIEQSVQNLVKSLPDGKNEVVLFQDQSDGNFVISLNQKTKSIYSYITFASPQSIREKPEFYENWERLINTSNLIQLTTSSINFNIVAGVN